MVNFRRVVTVLAVLALFTGLAFAQGQLSCSAQGTVATSLRGEGFTEQTGDIILNCTGGTAIQAGGNIPLVNITVYYGAFVTSRLLSSTDQRSEALLLIDEPNTFTGSYGSFLGLIPCTTPLQGCAQTVGAVPGTTFNTAVTSGATPAPNVYEGIVSGNAVTFYGVPVLPPATVGSRIYRITNVRVNANAYIGGTAVQAFIQASDPAALPISNSQPFVGYIANGLSATVKGAASPKQCVDQSSDTAISTLTFTENFGTAFKTRVAAVQNTLDNGQLGVLGPASELGGIYATAVPTYGTAATTQSIPGGLSKSESNFVYGGFSTTGGVIAGLADFGTRLKATFSGVPSGVKIYVSTVNIGATASPIGGSAGNLNTVSGAPYIGYAALVTSETATDGADGTVPLNTTALVPLDSTGTGTAVWEVVNTNPNTIESFSFSVSVAYTHTSTTPLAGSTASVTLSYAPTASSLNAASNSENVPTFSGGVIPSATFLTIGACRTVLLYPFITNQGGLDTGLSVANTSQDPMITGKAATVAQNGGSCTFTFYGGTTATPTIPPPVYKTQTDPNFATGIAGGTVWANTLGTIAPTFQGYAFAICNFQFAHGFAFISDIGATKIAMGYLAIVIPDVTPRIANPFGSGSPTGEQDAH